MRSWVPGLLAVVLTAQSGQVAAGNAAPKAARPANRIDIEATGFQPKEITCWAGEQISFANRSAIEHQPGILNADGSFVAFHAGVLKPGAVSDVFSPMPRL